MFHHEMSLTLERPSFMILRYLDLFGILQTNFENAICQAISYRFFIEIAS